MSDHSAIQWTDATWNPTTGCTKISPGCANCYIERTPAFRIAGNRFVNGKTDLSIFHDRLQQPLHWRKPRRVFVNSLSDLFHDDISDAFIDRVFAVMALCPQHTFQVLTKRPERMRAYMTNTKGPGGVITRVNAAGRAIPKGSWWRGEHTSYPWNNVWLGVSVENQHFADERIPLLLQTPAAVRFISAEPLLGPVEVSRYLREARAYGFHRNGNPKPMPHRDLPRLDWVIVGGESGPGARPFDVSWARSIVAQCRAARVACFMKQLGASAYETCPVCEGHGSVHGATAEYCGRCLGGHRQTVFYADRKGGDPAEWPDDLRVREYPLPRGTPRHASAPGGD